MKLVYIANARIPSEKAHPYQVLKMYEAFKSKVKLSPRMKWLIENAKGTTILDVGFVGSKSEPLVHLMIRQNNSSSRVIGCDIDEMKIRVLNLHNTLVSDVHFLPFVNSFFDVVVLGEFVEHFYNLSPLLKEVARVTQSGGKVLLTTPNPYGCPRWFKHWLLPSNPASIQNFKNFLYSEDHLVFWEPLSLCNILEQHQLRPVFITSRHQLVPLLCRLIPWLGNLDINVYPFNRTGLYTCIIARKK